MTEWWWEVNDFNHLGAIFLLKSFYHQFFLIMWLFSFCLYTITVSQKWLNDHFPSDQLEFTSHSIASIWEWDIFFITFLHIALPCFSMTRAISPAACVQVRKCECDWILFLFVCFLPLHFFWITRYVSSQRCSVHSSLSFSSQSSLGCGVKHEHMKSVLYIFLIYLHSHCIHTMTHYEIMQHKKLYSQTKILTLGLSGT